LTGAGTFTFNDTLLITGTANKIISGGRVVHLTGVTTWGGNAANNQNGIALSGGAVINNSGIFNDVNSFNASVTLSTGTASFNNTGTYDKFGAGSTTVQVPFANSGGLDLRTNAVAFTATTNPFTQSAGITRLLGGNMSVSGATGLNLTGGTLLGSGTITGNVRNAAVIEVGGITSAGTLSITGNYTQTAAGLLRMDIGGLVAGTEYDVLAISGSATLAGTLDLLLINAFDPVINDSFQLVTFASRTGSFNPVTGTSIPGGKTLNVSYGATSLVITVT
jgi:hypothetical protein